MENLIKAVSLLWALMTKEAKVKPKIDRCQILFFEIIVRSPFIAHQNCSVKCELTLLNWLSYGIE